jgi:parvulin-like peptidyl-prolyl isomerase
VEKKKRLLMVQSLYRDLIDSKTVVSEEEKRQFYADNPDLFLIPEKRQFGIVLTDSEEKAREAYDKLKAGASISEVAEAYSIDPETRKNRGLTDLVVKGDNPEIDEVGFALKNVGDISKPFKTSRGWVVLKLMQRQPKRTITFAEAEASINKRLKEEKNDKRLRKLLDKWRRQIPIEIYEENLSKITVKERNVETAG